MNKWGSTATVGGCAFPFLFTLRSSVGGGVRARLKRGRVPTTIIIRHVTLFIFFPLFIPDLIFLICSNPSGVKWAPSLINWATFLKYSKSLAFSPWSGYLSKYGIIFWLISENSVTQKSPRGLPDLCLNLPQLKKVTKLWSSCSSRICWDI
jgi:hypothetical protein